MTGLFDTNLSYSALQLFLKFYYFSSFHIQNLVLLYEFNQLLFTRVNTNQQGAVVSVHTMHKQLYSTGPRDTKLQASKKCITVKHHIYIWGFSSCMSRQGSLEPQPSRWKQTHTEVLPESKPTTVSFWEQVFQSCLWRAEVSFRHASFYSGSLPLINYVKPRSFQ